MFGSFLSKINWESGECSSSYLSNGKSLTIIGVDPSHRNNTTG